MQTKMPMNNAATSRIAPKLKLFACRTARDPAARDNATNAN